MLLFYRRFLEDKYETTQAGTDKERLQKFKSTNQQKIDRYKDEGAALENRVAEALPEGNFEAGAYKAHCSKCHMIADLDIVTTDSVIEVKKGKPNLKQMTERVIPVAQQCFPGKKIKIATGKDNLVNLKRTLAEKEWSSLGIEPVGF